MYQFSSRNILIISISLFLCSINPLLKTIIILLYICYAFKSINHSLIAFSFMSFLTLLNPNIIGYNQPVHFFIKIAFVLLMFLLTLLKNKNKILRLPLFKYVSYFSGIFLLINIFHPTNQYTSISILKIISFYSTISYLIISFSVLKDLNKIMSWIMSLFYFAIFASTFMYFFMYSQGTYPGSHGLSLFRGILVHPNALGVFFFPYLAVLLPSILNSDITLKKKYFFALMILLILIMTFLSGARGSFAGFSIGCLVVTIIYLFKKFQRMVDMLQMSINRLKTKEQPQTTMTLV